MLYPLKLNAAFKDYLWGGTRLRDEFNKQTDIDPVAESWELSCHHDGQSIISNGEFSGKTLAQYIETVGKQVIGTKAPKDKDFPILIKFIDAKQSLSVQVHPDDKYALLHEGESGKTEMWYVMDATPDATLIYGFTHKISHQEFERRIKDNTLLEVCNQVPIKKGDVFFIEAGTLHAIGAGALIAEIQQSSNSTYRVYDYGRVGKDGKLREVHIEKALAVTKLEPPTRKPEPIAKLTAFADYDLTILAQCKLFNVSHFDLHGNCSLNAKKDSFHSILALDGQIALTYGSDSFTITKGESVFIPADMGEYILNGTGEFILTTL